MTHRQDDSQDVATPAPSADILPFRRPATTPTATPPITAPEPAPFDGDDDGPSAA